MIAREIEPDIEQLGWLQAPSPPFSCEPWKRGPGSSRARSGSAGGDKSGQVATLSSRWPKEGHSGCIGGACSSPELAAEDLPGRNIAAPSEIVGDAEGKGGLWREISTPISAHNAQLWHLISVHEKPYYPHLP
eukprot:CAMPEP_0198736120 /NCGR_PEP_ID=MMETSP1475-20131203/63662_1 /TAXON_ID= ORGANISM="Unidentified sp., Strain CCMP1999" /NCGR_SAMPLE_ID=MMETSP1475 /ASSEMBLY_ACC=CAM_ASM_001111 /LENGTH=132 /DNA_ID=CAMNT_0044499881 /DNA_START=126 /DNA_END=521 /DNA_ORIENTATION=+